MSWELVTPSSFSQALTLKRWTREWKTKLIRQNKAREAEEIGEQQFQHTIIAEDIIEGWSDLEKKQKVIELKII